MKKNIATRLKAFGKCKQRLLWASFILFGQASSPRIPCWHFLIVCVQNEIHTLHALHCLYFSGTHLDRLQNSVNPKQRSPYVLLSDIYFSASVTQRETVHQPQSRFFLTSKGEQCKEPQSSLAGITVYHGNCK